MVDYVRKPVNPDQGSLDKDGYVGVDPIYQNYANDTDKPEEFSDEELKRVREAGGVTEEQDEELTKEAEATVENRRRQSEVSTITPQPVVVVNQASPEPSADDQPQPDQPALPDSDESDETDESENTDSSKN